MNLKCTKTLIESPSKVQNPSRFSPNQISLRLAQWQSNTHIEKISMQILNNTIWFVIYVILFLSMYLQIPYKRWSYCLAKCKWIEVLQWVAPACNSITKFNQHRNSIGINIRIVTDIEREEWINHNSERLWTRPCISMGFTWKNNETKSIIDQLRLFIFQEWYILLIVFFKIVPPSIVWFETYKCINLPLNQIEFRSKLHN